MKNYTCELDQSQFLSNCQYDLCSYSSESFQNAYLCRAMAAYALECAKVGQPLNWLSDPVFQKACALSNFTTCAYGQTYSDCSSNCFKTCKELSLDEPFDRICGNECVQGIQLSDKK